MLPPCSSLLCIRVDDFRQTFETPCSTPRLLYSVQSGKLPLVTAVMHEMDTVVSSLIRKGANIDAVHPATGSTPALHAVDMGRVATLRLLIDAGADVNRVNTKVGAAVSLRCHEPRRACRIHSVR